MHKIPLLLVAATLFVCQYLPAAYAQRVPTPTPNPSPEELTPQILPGSAAEENIQAAAEFIRSMGYVEVADDILLWLKNDWILIDSLGSGETATTSSIGKVITIDPYTTPIKHRQKNNFEFVVSLATLLFHEKIHAHQQVFLFEANKEYEAWTSTIQVLDKWIQTQTERYKLSNSESDRQKLEVLLVQKKTEILGFIENKCYRGWFGYRTWFESSSDPCAEWKTLLISVKALLSEVAQKKTIKQEEKRVGILLRRTEHDEQYALAGGPGSFDQQGIPVGLDLAPPTSLTGIYVGGSIGLRHTSTGWTTTDIDSLGASDLVGPDDGENMHSSSAYGALYAGLNWQASQRWFVGVEGDYGSGNNTADPGIPGTVPSIVSALAATNDSVAVHQTWDAALRARIGFIVNPFTNVFVAGGPAWQKEEATLRCSALGACGVNGILPFSSTNAITRAGWTMGAGIETQLWRQITGRFEYRHSDYGSYTAFFGNSAAIAVSSRLHSTSDVALVGLGYRWGP